MDLFLKRFARGVDSGVYQISIFLLYCERVYKLNFIFKEFDSQTFLAFLLNMQITKYKNIVTFVYILIFFILLSCGEKKEEVGDSDTTLNLNIGLNAYIDYAGAAGAFLSEYMGFHGIWYKDLNQYV